MAASYEDLVRMFEDDQEDDESDDEVYAESDDEDDESFTEAGRSRIRASRGRSYGRGIRGVSRGTIQTPAGNLRVNFGQNFVTTEQLKKALDEIRADVKQHANAIQAVDSSCKKTIKTTGKKLDKKLESLRQLQLMLMFLDKPAELSKITGPYDAASKTLTVSSTEYKEKDDMLPLMLMMGGDMFGGSDSNSMLMALLLTKAL